MRQSLDDVKQMICLDNSYVTYMYNMYGDREEQLIVEDSKSAELLYRCFTVAKFCSAFAAHEM